MAAELKTKPDVRSIVTDDEFGGFRITIPPAAKAWVGSGIVLAIWVLVMGLTLLGLSRRPLSGNVEGIKFFLILLTLGVGFAFIAGSNLAAPGYGDHRGKVADSAQGVLGFSQGADVRV